VDLDAITRRTGVRFDTHLGSFNELLTFYFENASKDKDRKIVAQGPLCPADLVFAAGAVPYDLNTRASLRAIFDGQVDVSQEAIDAQMSPEFSSWNLIMLGSVLSAKCESNIDLYATALGGFDEQVAKSFHLLAEACRKPIHFWEVPMYDAASEARAIRHLEKELDLYFRWLGGHTRNQANDGSLSHAIRWGNTLRSDMSALNACLLSEVVPLKALEYYLVQVMLGDCAQDPEKLHKLFVKLIEEIKDRVRLGNTGCAQPKPIRVYLIGDETQELGLYNAIEEHGGALVGCSSRLSLYYSLVDEKTRPISALASWIWHMPCNLPAQARIKREIEFIQIQRPDAIIINSTVGSRFLPGFERLNKDILKRELGIPVLCIETSFPGENIDKVDYQINALMQTLSSGY
jgi:benzoyl-CoA reductase/2-hydroxyglutaryl-CoA dehydratase subunit BcrC/BadD/HgdB